MIEEGDLRIRKPDEVRLAVGVYQDALRDIVSRELHGAIESSPAASPRQAGGRQTLIEVRPCQHASN
jgi:hypothetical protein